MYTFDAGSLMEFANQVKDRLAFVTGANFDNVIVVVGQKNWFGKIKDRLFGTSENDDLVIDVSFVEQPK